MKDEFRKIARGMPCLIRGAGVCNGRLDTTIAAHYRLAGLCGVGMKPNDLIAAHSCSCCHDYVDGRSKHVIVEEWGPEYRAFMQRRLDHAEGVMRTLDTLTRLGYRMVKMDD